MIKISNLSKEFGNRVLFENLNLEILEGDMIALVGKSGCGKSTLLNIMGTLDREFQGSITVNGHDITKMTSKKQSEFVRNNISYLFQNYALIDDETIEDNLKMAQKYKKMSKKEKTDEISNVLKEVGLDGMEKSKVFTLSGGEQQRVALARAIIKPGTILLADEPTGNLDKENAKSVLSIIKKYNLSGKTVVLVTHDSDVANQCTKIINLD